MSVLNAIPLLLLELELSLQRLTSIAQTGPPPAVMASIYEHGKRSVDILEARAKKKGAILEALAKNHDVIEDATSDKIRAYFWGHVTHRKRAREEDLICNESI